MQIKKFPIHFIGSTRDGHGNMVMQFLYENEKGEVENKQITMGLSYEDELSFTNELPYIEFEHNENWNDLEFKKVYIQRNQTELKD